MARLPRITVSEINGRDLVPVAAEVEPETGVAEHTPLKEAIPLAIIHRSEIEATAWLPQITVSEINRRDLVLVAAEVEPENGVAEDTPLKESLKETRSAGALTENPLRITESTIWKISF